jgi:transcriptional regulator with XRE-family HTH domain
MKDLRNEAKLTQEQLANTLSLSQQAISGYENGARFPDQDTLEKIADFFDVSIDYLLGRSDTRNPYSEEKNKSVEKKHGITTKAYHNLDVGGLSEEDIQAVEAIIEQLKKKYNSDGTLKTKD